MTCYGKGKLYYDLTKTFCLKLTHNRETTCPTPETTPTPTKFNTAYIQQMLLDYVTINVPLYMNYVTSRRRPLLIQTVFMDETKLGLFVMVA